AIHTPSRQPNASIIHATTGGVTAAPRPTPMASRPRDSANWSGGNHATNAPEPTGYKGAWAVPSKNRDASSSASMLAPTANAGTATKPNAAATPNIAEKNNTRR